MLASLAKIADGIMGAFTIREKLQKYTEYAEGVYKERNLHLLWEEQARGIIL